MYLTRKSLIPDSAPPTGGNATPSDGDHREASRAPPNSRTSSFARRDLCEGPPGDRGPLLTVPSFDIGPAAGTGAGAASDPPTPSFPRWGAHPPAILEDSPADPTAYPPDDPSRDPPGDPTRDPSGAPSAAGEARADGAGRGRADSQGTEDSASVGDGAEAAGVGRSRSVSWEGGVNGSGSGDFDGFRLPDGVERDPSTGEDPPERTVSGLPRRVERALSRVRD